MIPTIWINMQDAKVDDLDFYEYESCTPELKIPCFLKYSSFKPEYNWSFSATVAGIASVGLLGFMYKWADYDKANVYNSYYGNRRFPIASRFFNAWDWKHDEEDDVDSVAYVLWRDLI